MKIQNPWCALRKLHTWITSTNLMELGSGCQVAAPQTVVSEGVGRIRFPPLQENGPKLTAPNRPNCPTVTTG